MRSPFPFLTALLLLSACLRDETVSGYARASGG